MRKYFIIPIIFVLLFNNYTWSEIRYAFNNYGTLLFPSNPFIGGFLILLVIMAITFTDEINKAFQFGRTRIRRKV